jgi:YD repeat-containing protein
MADVLVAGLDFGEGPRWRDGKLWYSDFYRHGVFTTDLSGAEQRVCTVDHQPSGLGWLPDGRLLIVSMTDRQVLRLEPSGELVAHADLSSVATFHTNDMLVADDGRAWVGNFGFDLHGLLEETDVLSALARIQADPASYTATVAHVAADGTVTPASEPMLFPNGMVIRGDTLLVAETLAFRVQAFDIAPDGSLGNPRTFAGFTADDGILPDGICDGPDGSLFIAPAIWPEVIHVDTNGEVIARHSCSQTVYAVAWDGGDNLFAMTAPGSEPRVVAGAGQGKVEHITL